MFGKTTLSGPTVSLALALTSLALVFVSGDALAAQKKASAPPVRIEAANAIASSDTVVPPADTEVEDTVSALPVTIGSTIALPDPTGEWMCPVAVGKFTNDWGQARSGGRRHEGTDMLAPRGTPVRAPVSGVVKKSNGGMSGLTFNLTGVDGYVYVGMHLSAFGAEGPVKMGDVVGYVGDSGNARGTNHLHFEIHPAKRTKINPYSTLRKYCG
jgi:murein DD-endopeptidase MepM/ murein hydrolase activator NlpD